MKTLESRFLQALEPWCQAPAWRVAFSGGLDSTVLLHLLAGLRRSRQIPPLSAIHIQHGLQPAAAQWPAHCLAVCTALGLPLQVECVEVSRELSSLERAARLARYQAFARLLLPGEVLLTAQHADDQAETLLFRLLRGSGLRGLTAMPGSRTLGAGTLLRPLLDVSRAELQAYALKHRLGWVEDPSNADCHYARNYLRHRVMPLLEQRWPAVPAVLARTAEHLAEAQGLLEELAAQDLLAARSDPQPAWLPLPTLCLDPLRALGEARQRNALRTFLEPLTSLPDTVHWAGWQALRDATAEAKPVWRLASGALHREGRHIWWLAGSWLQAVAADIHWAAADQPLQLPGNGCVSLRGAVPDGELSIRYRRGGEELLIPGRGHRDLKRLLNEARVPAFVRSRLPLLYCGEQLLAVANLPGLCAGPGIGCELRWSPPDCAQGLS